MAGVTPRMVDGRGRLTLGKDFANKHVLVRQVSAVEMIVTLAQVVPEAEAWLWNNPAALASVRRGLDQAAAGDFAKNAPDLKADEDLASRLED